MPQGAVQVVLTAEAESGCDSDDSGRLQQGRQVVKGVLRKRSRLTHTWVRVLAELRANALVLDGGGARKVYDLTEASRVTKNKGSLIFLDFGASRRVLQLSANSEEDADRWLQHFNEARAAVTRESFVPISAIGEGQFGKVFLATRQDHRQHGLSDKRLVAVKEVSTLQGETHIHSALRERQILIAVPPHPFIVNLRHTFRAGSLLYFVLDFHSGGDLFEMLQRSPEAVAARARFYAAEALLGLQHLHANDVLYRDLKPENVLIKRNGHIVLADFGSSKLLGAGERTFTECGTRAYVAPEMLLSAGEGGESGGGRSSAAGSGYGRAIDFWQFGCFLFELHAGHSPFWVPPPGGAAACDSVTPPLADAAAQEPSAEAIFTCKVNYPHEMDVAVQKAVGKLLIADPSLRTTDWDVLRSLPYFASVDWAAALRGELTPPSLPLPEGEDHVANFQPSFAELPAMWSAQPLRRVSKNALPAYVEGLVDSEVVGFSWSRDE